MNPIDRILKDIVDFRYDTRSAAHDALRTLPGVLMVEIAHRETTLFRANGVESSMTWTVSACHTDPRSQPHTRHHMSLHKCVCAVLTAYRLNPLGLSNDRKQLHGAVAEDVTDNFYPHSEMDGGMNH